MKFRSFFELGVELSNVAGVTSSLHAYFKQAAPRLYKAGQLFNLLENAHLGDVLEIGPFFGYMPFILRNKASSFTILEAEDPIIECLIPLYNSHGIDLKLSDLFEVFGPTTKATHKLELPDGSFDTILCWETMEHFGFNPVKFVRELHRILKPGGRVCITVPNKASFQAIYSCITGRSEVQSIAAFFEYENYMTGNKNVFYGFHWREYTPLELSALFRGVGFNVVACSGFTAFHDHSKPTIGRKIARLISSIGTYIASRYGTNVYLEAIKS
jgi:SAM-dependent methyltransferase